MQNALPKARFCFNAIWKFPNHIVFIYDYLHNYK